MAFEIAAIAAACFVSGLSGAFLGRCLGGNRGRQRDSDLNTSIIETCFYLTLLGLHEKKDDQKLREGIIVRLKCYLDTYRKLKGTMPASALNAVLEKYHPQVRDDLERAEKLECLS